jgi:hypothetical protein
MVEAAARHAQAARQPVHLHPGNSFFNEGAPRCIDPGFGRDPRCSSAHQTRLPSWDALKLEEMCNKNLETPNLF